MTQRRRRRSGEPAPAYPAPAGRRRLRQPLGKSEALLEREAEMEERRRRVYGNAPLPPEDSRKPRRRPKRRHTFGWALLCLLSLAVIAASALAVVPQITGRWPEELPQMAFVDGRLLRRDEAAEAAYGAMIRDVQRDTFYEGVSVDGIALGGLSMEEARAAVMQTEATGGGTFSVEVQVDKRRWRIDSDLVPLQRDTEAQLMKAWAAGRTVRYDHAAPASTLPARQAAASELKRSPVSLVTTLTYDIGVVRSLTDQIADKCAVAPVNAEVTGFNMNTKTFSVSADQDGASVDADQLFREVKACLDRGEAVSEVRVHTTPIHAAVTQRALSASLGRMASCTTSTTSNKNRNTNINLSAQAINGAVVQPGETFSFNQSTGERSASKGYKEATAISGGQSVPEVGGGVCQTSSTLFGAVARANLEIVSRSPHAWPSSYVEKGMDATVNWPSLDFRWKNNTDAPVYIVAWYSDRKVTVELYGKTLGDGVTIDLTSQVTRTLEPPAGIKEVLNPELPAGTRKTTVQSRRGYVVDTYQVWKRNGVEFQRTLLCTSTYKAYQETVEYN